MSGCGNVDFWPQIRSNIVFARLRPNFNSSIPDWLHPLIYPRLACLSLPRPPNPLPSHPPHSSHFVFFPLHHFISLLYFFIHETEKSLSLIICLISSFPTLLFYKQQVNLHRKLALALPSTFFWKIRVGQSLEVYPIVFTNKRSSETSCLVILSDPPLTVR